MGCGGCSKKAKPVIYYYCCQSCGAVRAIRGYYNKLSKTIDQQECFNCGERTVVIRKTPQRAGIPVNKTS